MRHKKRPFRRDDRKRYTYGRFIKEERVVVIDENNENLGVIDTRKGLSLAKEAGLELVVVSQGKKGSPSTCKILDLGKYKYDQERKEKAAKKKQRENSIKLKEVKFRPSTGENDLLVKANQFQDFLEEGNRLKITIMFRGREMAHKDIGLDTMNKFIQMVQGKYDSEPSMTGRNLTAIVVKDLSSTSSTSSISTPDISEAKVANQ